MFKAAVLNCNSHYIYGLWFSKKLLGNFKLVVILNYISGVCCSTAYLFSYSFLAVPITTKNNTREKIYNAVGTYFYLYFRKCTICAISFSAACNGVLHNTK